VEGLAISLDGKQLADDEVLTSIGLHGVLQEATV
jgi:hypothetical protein